ncbi:MAG: primary-amine oxidase [Geminicoccaceae bacterium]
MRVLRSLAWSVSFGAITLLGSGAFAAPTHPLDALTDEEYGQVRSILEAHGHVGETSAFAIISLEEPAKEDVLAWSEGDPISRVAAAVVREGPKMFEATVDLVEKSVLDFTEVEGKQSSILFSEWVAGGEITQSDPGWQEAMKARGYDEIDPERFLCLPFSAGYFAEPELEGKRLLRVQCFDQEGTTTSVYTRPIENLTAIVDLNAGEVVRLIDEGPVPVPEPHGNYDVPSVSPLLPAMNPIEVTQPDGPSYQIDGSKVTWGPWSFHLRLDRRSGPVVSLVTFADDGEDRSVLYQASLSEMFVPYMDPAQGWFYKTYFDAGEYGFGMFATPLVKGVDCPAHATFIDGVLAFDDAEPVPYPQALCIFERPTMGPAWRHSEFLNETYEGRPGRNLVVRMAAAIGNYDYIYDWVFMPTGAIKVDIASTGIDITKAVETQHMDDATAAEDTAYGTLVAPGLVAPYHDHYFALRLDFDVDGRNNSFVKDTFVRETLPEDHPRASIWTIEREVAQTEADAQLDIDLKNPVQWRIQSNDRTNALGNPTGYVLKTTGNAYTQLSDDDWPHKRAGFTKHHLWVTAFDAQEKYAAGDYPNQSQGGDGLPAWTASNRTIENTDLVLWYTLGFHHITAAEDWPVLPSHPKSVMIAPHNFFDRNPIINAPPVQTAQN